MLYNLRYVLYKVFPNLTALVQCVNLFYKISTKVSNHVFSSFSTKGGNTLKRSLVKYSRSTSLTSYLILKKFRILTLCWLRHKIRQLKYNVACTLNIIRKSVCAWVLLCILPILLKWTKTIVFKSRRITLWERFGKSTQTDLYIINVWKYKYNIDTKGWNALNVNTYSVKLIHN